MDTYFVEYGLFRNDKAIAGQLALCALSITHVSESSFGSIIDRGGEIYQGLCKKHGVKFDLKDRKIDAEADARDAIS